MVRNATITAEYIDTAEALLTDMAGYRGDWDWLRKHIMPHSRAAADNQQYPSSSVKRLHSTTAIKSLRILTGAHIMYITPSNQRWFSLQSGLRGRNKSTRVDEWFSESTETMFSELGRSNFYTEIHETFLDRCLTGTGCLYCDTMPNGRLNFKHIAAGTYAIAENESGQVDTLVRQFQLTPHQAVSKFGYKNLPARVQEAWDNTKTRYTQRHEYIHLVLPRQTCDFGHDLINKRRMKWASLYIYRGEDRQLIKEEGYNEFPYLVTRFLRYGESPYGYAPGLDVQEEITATLKLERVMDVLGEVAAFPRILQLAEQVGEVDLRAGGITTIKPGAANAQLPREWGTSGKYDVGKDRIADKEEKIREAFFVDMLMPLANVERQMTATEINARQEERVLSFSPSLTLFIADCNILIHRVFSILFRQGKFPQDDVPSELIVPDMGGSENFEIEIPDVQYLGRISQAIANAQQQGLEYFMQVAMTYTQATGDTSMIEYVNPRKFAQFLYERTGAPTSCRRTARELADLDKQKQQDADMQRKLAATQGAQNAAKAQKDLASAGAS